MNNPFAGETPQSDTIDGLYDDAERSLANRNSGTLLETLSLDVTPIGAHYLLTHFDTPIISKEKHVLRFVGDFDKPFDITMEELMGLPKVTLPVTLECAGNGRVGMSPRRHSMPWGYEAVGTSEWTGTLLKPLISEARAKESVVEFSFTGADFGYDKGVGHFYGRSLTVEQAKDLDILLVYEDERTTVTAAARIPDQDSLCPDGMVWHLSNGLQTSERSLNPTQVFNRFKLTDTEKALRMWGVPLPKF